MRVLQAEWIVDLTTRADREGKHADYANRYDRSDLKVANLKELNMQIDRGYRVSARRQPALLAGLRGALQVGGSQALWLCCCMFAERGPDWVAGVAPGVR